MQIFIHLLETGSLTVGQRVNWAVRAPTVIATAFLSPAFIVGVRGMNLNRHAGQCGALIIEQPSGYVILTPILIALAGMTIGCFRRRRSL